MFLWIEFLLVVISATVAFALPNLASGWFQRAEQLLNRLAERRGLAVATVGLSALAARAALLPILPVPEPAGTDEFGYLLLADTFAHGRLANPTHPMWVHFESFHIFWQPSYTAKFFPAQGLIMAVGQVIMGHPFWGVWLSVALMCAAICWMLQGWLPPGWALLGGFLAVIRLGTFSYWANSYWGGAVAATGGALVLGALPRIKRSQRVRDALLMGLGLALIVNSRPYEGLFFSLPLAGALAVWMLGKNRPPLSLAARRVLAPLSLVLVLTGLAMGYYFWRVTGSPWRTPYSVNERTYEPAPDFPWQSLRPVQAYHHEVLRYSYGAVVRTYWETRSIEGIVTRKVGLLVWLWSFFLGPALTLPLLAALATLPYGFSWRDISRDTRFLLLVCGAVIAGAMLPIWFSPHYAAPITGAIVALVLQAMRRLRFQRWHGRPVGVSITRAVPLVCLLLLALRVGAKPLHLPEPRRWLAGATFPTWCSLGPGLQERAVMLAQLERRPGRHLVIVCYGPDHPIDFHEWVYNEANLDAAKVIWARDMGPAQNEDLINYFRDRHVWLINADETPPRLIPYLMAASR
jgi:hypothetical protein